MPVCFQTCLEGCCSQCFNPGPTITRNLPGHQNAMSLSSTPCSPSRIDLSSSVSSASSASPVRIKVGKHTLVTRREKGNSSEQTSTAGQHSRLYQKLTQFLSVVAYQPIFSNSDNRPMDPSASVHLFDIKEGEDVFILL